MHKSALALLAAALCNNAIACDCTQILDRASAGLVFEGTPTAKNIWLRKGDEPGGAFSTMVRFTFDVSRTIKGRLQSPIVIDTPAHNCGVRFRLWQRYRVYAFSQSDLGIQWVADICSKTTPIGQPARKKQQTRVSAPSPNYALKRTCADEVARSITHSGRAGRLA